MGVISFVVFTSNFSLPHYTETSQLTTQLTSLSQLTAKPGWINQSISKRYSVNWILIGWLLWSSRALSHSSKPFTLFRREVSCCRAQHLWFEPVTSHLSVAAEVPSASRSAQGSAWTDSCISPHILLGSLSSWTVYPALKICHLCSGKDSKSSQ